VNSSNLFAANHALCRLRNLMCTNGTKCDGNLKAAAGFQHRDNIGKWKAFEQQILAEATSMVRWA
jgi:hypothetical protein